MSWASDCDSTCSSVTLGEPSLDRNSGMTPPRDFRWPLVGKAKLVLGTLPELQELQDLKKRQEQHERRENLHCNLDDTLSTNNMVASVQCLTVRFRSTQAEQSNQRFCHNIGSAFAFTKNYLFTTHRLLQEFDPDFEIDGVWISDPADPLTKLGCRVRALGSVEELDVALLECDQIDLPDYDLCHTPPHNPLVIYVAHRGQSLAPEIRRGTAYPLRRRYEGLCCIRPMKRCTGAPVLDSHARVIGMLKSGSSFVTSDGLMHALKQIGMLLDGDDYAEIDDLCSLWEFNRAVMEEEHAVAKILQKRHAEEQGGRTTKKAKESPPAGEGHEMERAHEHGMNKHSRPVNYSSILNPCAQTVLESVEAVHAKEMGRRDFLLHEPTAFSTKHRLDQKEPAYLYQSAQKYPAHRSPVVVRSGQSLEDTSGYTTYEPLLNSPFYQPWSINKCRDSQDFENSKQYFTNREPHVSSRADDDYSSLRYTQGEQSLESENCIFDRTFDSPMGLQSLNVPNIQRRFSASGNTDLLLNFNPNYVETISDWNPPSIHEQQLESEVGDLPRRYQSNPSPKPQQQPSEGKSLGFNRTSPQTPGLCWGLEEARNQARLRLLPPRQPVLSTSYHGMDVPSLHQQQQTQPTFTQPIYPNVPATARNWPLPSDHDVKHTPDPFDAYRNRQETTSFPPKPPLPPRTTLPPLAPKKFDGTKLPPIYQQPQTTSAPMQAICHNNKATDSNVRSSPYRSFIRKGRTVDEPQLQHRHQQDVDETGICRWQLIAWDQFSPTPPNPDKDAPPSLRGYFPPTPTSMKAFPGSRFIMKSIPKTQAPRRRLRTRSRQTVYPSKYQLLNNQVPRSPAIEKYQHEILLPSEGSSVAESISGDESIDIDLAAMEEDLDAEMTKDGNHEHSADDVSITDSDLEDESVGSHA